MHANGQADLCVLSLRTPNNESPKTYRSKPQNFMYKETIVTSNKFHNSGIPSDSEDY